MSDEVSVRVKKIGRAWKLEALQWTGQNIDQLKEFAGEENIRVGCPGIYGEVVYLLMEEGGVSAIFKAVYEGNWVIKTEEGKLLVAQIGE